MCGGPCLNSVGKGLQFKRVLRSVFFISRLAASFVHARLMRAKGGVVHSGVLAELCNIHERPVCWLLLWQERKPGKHKATRVISCLAV